MQISERDRWRYPGDTSLCESILGDSEIRRVIEGSKTARDQDSARAHLLGGAVLVELAVALSLKAPREIVLIAQGDLRALHFNIKDNRVIPYDAQDAVAGIAAALADGTRSFEDLMGHRMSAVRRSLSPHALYLLDLCRRSGAAERPLTATDLRDDALSGLERGATRSRPTAPRASSRTGD
jgi:hypothetical protein